MALPSGFSSGVPYRRRSTSYRKRGGRRAVRIRDVYQDLGHPDRILIWHEGNAEPNPLHVAEYATSAPLGAARPVSVLRPNGLPASGVEDDTWVGAAVAVVKFDKAGGECVVNCHTASPDGRNDWLSAISLRFG